MLTAHTIKIIQSLDKKKFRQKYNLFLVEGHKTIYEVINSHFKINGIFSVNPEDPLLNNASAISISASDLKKISFLQHPKDGVALCEIPKHEILPDEPLNIVLDGIQDPGNLGTIIRLADWFGIRQIVCSEDTVDCFNPKVVQASMGSFTRVNIVYTPLQEFLQNTENANVGTDMHGDNIYSFNFPPKMNLILGNEGNGMRPETEALISEKITIPRFGSSKSTESLNVSMAAGIILGQIFSGNSRS